MAESLAQDYDAMRLQPLTPVIGLEVLDVDLRKPPTPQFIDRLSELLVAHKVLFFRDQDLTIEQHKAFAAGFGELEIHPFTPNNTEHPEVIHLNNDRDNPPNINVWHSDVTWRSVPSLGSILRAKVVPSVGGDTLFANMEAAYDQLDDATKERIDGLSAWHDNEYFLRGMRERGAKPEAIEALRAKFPPSKHPVVRTHPVSGRKSIYVNTAFTRSIEGLSDTESKELLTTLYRTAWSPDVQCRFRWQPNSIAFWDNRAAQHFAAADYWPEERSMERVTIVGQRPV